MIRKFNEHMSSGVDVDFITVNDLSDIDKLAHTVIGTVSTTILRTHAASRAMSSVLSSAAVIDYDWRIKSVLEGVFPVEEDGAPEHRSGLSEPKTVVPKAATEIRWDSLPAHDIILKTFMPPKRLTDLRTRTLLLPAIIPIPDSTDGQTRMKWVPEPFAKGACRWAFDAQVQMEGRSKGWNRFVGKRFIVPRSSEADHGESRYLASIQDSVIAMYLAEAFNATNLAKYKILFLPAYMGEVTHEGRKEYFSLEPKLPEAPFVKWSNNAGDWDLNILAKELLLFTKFTYEATNGYMLVSDLQGVVDSSHNYILTDPAVLCQDVDRFGSVNLGKAAMDATYEMARKLLQELG